MPTRTCSICGDSYGPDSSRWFLVVENSWEDKLKILEWNEQLAWNVGIRQACSIRHVQELVVHWMTTGTMDYPFAEVRRVVRRLRATNFDHGIKDYEAPPRPIGELAVDRESMKRVLSESPKSLKAILDALLAALQRDKPVVARSCVTSPRG